MLSQHKEEEATLLRNEMPESTQSGPYQESTLPLSRILSPAFTWESLRISSDRKTYRRGQGLKTGPEFPAPLRMALNA